MLFCNVWVKKARWLKSGGLNRAGVSSRTPERPQLTKCVSYYTLRRISRGKWTHPSVFVLTYRWLVPVTAPSPDPVHAGIASHSLTVQGGNGWRLGTATFPDVFGSFKWNLTSWFKCALSPESHRPTSHLTWFHSQRPQLHHSSFMAVALQFSTVFLSKLEKKKKLPTSENTLGMSGCDIGIVISHRSDFEVFISKRLRQTRLHGHEPWFLFVLENKSNICFIFLHYSFIGYETLSRHRLGCTFIYKVKFHRNDGYEAAEHSFGNILPLMAVCTDVTHLELHMWMFDIFRQRWSATRRNRSKKFTQLFIELVCREGGWHTQASEAEGTSP